MFRLPHETMSAPPPGAVQAATIGDKPVDAKQDSKFGDPIVEVCCVLIGDNGIGVTEADKPKKEDWGAWYVECFYSTLSRYAPPNLRWNFTCFTDRERIEGIPCKKLPQTVWGAFDADATVLCFDLRTCIVGSWGGIANRLKQMPLGNRKSFVLQDWKAWQTLLPGQFTYYKGTVLSVDTRVVAFRGNAEPHEVVARWNPFWRGVREAPQAILTGDGIRG